MRHPKNIELGNGVYIKSNSRICPCNAKAKILIGENTTIGYNTIIFASEKIVIGKNCMVAPNVYIVDSDHGTSKGSLMNKQDNITQEIIIGDDVWIASGATILKGAVIPDGCVIAANAVVKGNLKPYTIYGGIPAKKIGERV
jgi:acetyltransferase-like isoleucine patch superfamily enzyme